MISIGLCCLPCIETAAPHPRALLYNRYKVACPRLDRVVPPPYAKTGKFLQGESAGHRQQAVAERSRKPAIPVTFENLGEWLWQSLPAARVRWRGEFRSLL
jgi:hypothetical protein